MKLLKLLTTFIITLASFNVFAKTFLCENWVDRFDGEMQGSMFVGNKDGNTLVIKHRGYEITLTYIGKNITHEYYTSGGDLYTGIWSISEITAIKYSQDGNTELGKYDFKITELFGEGVLSQTFCNYQ